MDRSKWISGTFRQSSQGILDLYPLSSLPRDRETDRERERERERGGEEEEEEEKRSKTKTKALLRCGTGMPIEN